MGASMKVKAWKVGDAKQPYFPADFKVTKRWEGIVQTYRKIQTSFTILK